MHNKVVATGTMKTGVCTFGSKLKSTQLDTG